MYQFLSLVALLVVLTACSSNQQEVSSIGVSNVEPDIRIVTEEPDPRICQYINDTTAHASHGDLGQAERNVRTMMKRKAAGMGGNVVRLDTYLVDNNEVVFGGRVFKCDMSINPEAVLGKVDRSIAPATSQSGTQLTGGNSTSNTASGDAGGSSEATTQRTNRPPEPTAAFDEAAFLNAGENEFDG